MARSTYVASPGDSLVCTCAALGQARLGLICRTPGPLLAKDLQALRVWSLNLDRRGFDLRDLPDGDLITLL